MAAIGRWLNSLLAVLAVSRAAAEAVPVERDFVVRSWRTEHGLPNNEIRAIRQSRDGYLWIGTPSGLARFEGRRFHLVRRGDPPEFANDECVQLHEDDRGALVVVTGDGLTVLQAEAVRYDFTAIAAEQIPAERLGLVGRWTDAGTVLSVSELAPGQLLVGTHRGLFAQNGGQWKYLAADEPPRYVPYAHTQLRTRAGVCWVGSRVGLVAVEREPSGNVRLRRALSPAGMDFGHAFAEDDAGRLWAIAGNEDPQIGWLLRYADGEWKQAWGRPLTNGSRPLFLMADHEGALWLPRELGGLIRWTPGETVEYELGLASRDFVTTVAADREGNLWVGTERNGLLCLQPRRMRTWTTRDGLPHDNTWVLGETVTGAWCVGTDGGLWIGSGERARVFQEPDGLARNEVRALATDPLGRLWIGTHAGLNVIEADTLARVSHTGAGFEAKTRVIHPAADGSVWVGTVTGLHQVVPTDGAWTIQQVLRGLDVRTMIYAEDGGLLLGTEGNGLHRWTRGGVRSERVLEGVPGEKIWQLYRDEAGVLWLASEVGLGCWRDGKRFTFTSAHGLPANEVNTLVADTHDDLWVGHDRGIYRVARQALFDVMDGRSSRARCASYRGDSEREHIEVNGQKSHPASLRLRDGRILFATTRGVVEFDPRNPPDVAVPPAPVIEEVEANGTVFYRYEPGNSLPGAEPPQLILPPGSGRMLKLAYTGCAFVAPGATRFKYRLAGLDPDWISAGTLRQASYANLRPGLYRFEVMATNPLGLAAEPGARILLKLEPHFHQTAWFRGSVAIGLLGLVSATVRWGSRRANHLHQLRREAALSRERARLAKDLHDSLGPRLTELTLLTRADQTLLATDNLKERLDGAADCTHDLLHALRDIIWANSPAADTIESLAGRLSELSTRLLAAASIRCRLDVPLELPAHRVSPAFRREVLRVTEEALNNIVRHAEATEARLQLRLADHTFGLQIEDNGQGFRAAPTSAAGPAGLGLESMRERVESLDGSFSVHSAPGHGTCIRFSLPLPADDASSPRDAPKPGEAG